MRPTTKLWTGWVLVGEPLRGSHYLASDELYVTREAAREALATYRLDSPWGWVGVHVRRATIRRER